MTSKLIAPHRHGRERQRNCVGRSGNMEVYHQEYPIYLSGA
jgi:hypothetical protein